MEPKTLVVWFSLISTIAGSTWFAATTFAKESDLKVANTKAEVALDISIDSLVAQLALLESKPKKTPYDLTKIKYLQEEIKRLRKLRSL